MPNREVISIVKSASLPALLLHVPDTEILAASDEAGRLLGVAADELIGRKAEDFAADSPDEVLDLIVTGRLAGFQSQRQLTRADGGIEPLQVWVRGVDSGTPVTTAVVVLWPSGNRAWTYQPGPSDGDRHVIIGTVDGELQIERVSDDVRALGSEPLELIGRPFLRLVDIDSAADVLHGLSEAASSRQGVGLRVNLRVGHEAAMADLMVSPLNPIPSFSFSLSFGTGEDESLPVLTPVGIERMAHNLHALSMADMLSTLGGLDVRGLERLTTRELDIVARLLRGDRVPAIAKALFLSPSTVRNHLSNVFQKLRVNSQQELIELFRESA